jgi:GR25 family glycosyltransferase involved in LPS biosynthesis
MIIDRYSVWMICLENDPRREMVLPSWSEYTVNRFDAITPKTRSSVDVKLNFSDFKITVNRGKLLFSEEEKSSFTSHLLLWKKCAEQDETFCIIEEDVELGSLLPATKDPGLVPIATRRVDDKTITPAAGYIVQPWVAKNMYDYFVATQRLITYNVDHHIDQRIHPKYRRKYLCAYQIEGESAIARV